MKTVSGLGVTSKEKFYSEKLGTHKAGNNGVGCPGIGVGVNRSSTGGLAEENHS